MAASLKQESMNRAQKHKQKLMELDKTRVSTMKMNDIGMEDQMKK